MPTQLQRLFVEHRHRQPDDLHEHAQRDHQHEHLPAGRLLCCGAIARLYKPGRNSDLIHRHRAEVPASHGVGVNGNLQVQGTAQAPVILTSFKDDTVGGDTDGDNATTQSSCVDWFGLSASATAQSI